MGACDIISSVLSVTGEFTGKELLHAWPSTRTQPPWKDGVDTFADAPSALAGHVTDAIYLGSQVWLEIDCVFDRVVSAQFDGRTLGIAPSGEELRASDHALRKPQSTQGGSGKENPRR